MRSVWHLELDFRVKALDLEPGCNVYKGSVPVNEPVSLGRGSKDESEAYRVRHRGLGTRDDRGLCRVPCGRQWRLLSAVPVLPVNSDRRRRPARVTARVLLGVPTMASAGGTRARVARMRRVVGILLLVVVGFGAVWCVDGCVDPTRDAGPLRSSGGGATCVVCVVPFTTTAHFSLPVQYAVLQPVDHGPVVHLWTPPVFSIDHPPRTL